MLAKSPPKKPMLSSQKAKKAEKPESMMKKLTFYYR